MPHPTRLRVPGSLLHRLIVVLVAAASALPEVASSAGDGGACAAHAAFREACGSIKPAEVPPNLAKRTALMQKDARRAPGKALAQTESSHSVTAHRGGISKVEQSIARRDRALVRAMKARTAAQQAKSRRLRLEAARAKRLRMKVERERVTKRLQALEAVARRSGGSSKHNKQEGRLINPMVMMVLFLMSAPVGVMVAVVGAVLFTRRFEASPLTM